MSYNRRRFLQALLNQGASIIREGGRHTIVAMATGRQCPVPRHADVNRILAKKIARQLGLPWSEIKKGL
ncbi:MAG: type II toxin-antitoxin system HicA family toxin [Tepidisphaerales bacterium]